MVERKVKNDEPPSDEAKVEEAPPAPDSVIVPIHNPPSAPRGPPPPAAPDNDNDNLHPVMRVMQEKDLGKAVIAFAIPIAMAIVTAGKDKPAAQSEMTTFILIFLCVGFAAILNGILLKETYPKYAPIAEAVGIALVATAFFSVVAVFLPAEASWLPALCIVLCLLPFGIAVCQPRAASEISR